MICGGGGSPYQARHQPIPYQAVSPSSTSVLKFDDLQPGVKPQQIRNASQDLQANIAYSNRRTGDLCSTPHYVTRAVRQLGSCRCIDEAQSPHTNTNVFSLPVFFYLARRTLRFRVTTISFKPIEIRIVHGKIKSMHRSALSRIVEHTLNRS